MRTFVGVIAVLGLVVTVAVAQPPRERGATFLPPEPLKPGDVPPVARGAAADDFPPSSFPSTPVTRPNTGTGSGRPGVAGPAWLNGPSADPGVVPAGGSATRGNNVRQLTPQPKDEPGLLSKGFDRLKGHAPQPQPQSQQPEPTASTPFRGTSASGSPVFAGPPAYRWYGWGTVTPGANPFAPAGEYPKASANWYSITGATPGAFPVPVMNPLRTPPGTEPPNYSANRGTYPQQQAIVPVTTQSQPPLQQAPQFQPRPQPQPQIQPAPVPQNDRPEPPKFNPTGESKFAPVPDAGTPPATVQKPAVPVNVPRITAPPVLPPVAIAPPIVPEPPAVAAAVKEPAPIPFPPATTVLKPEPVAEQPVGPRIATPSVLPAVEPTKPVVVPQLPPGPLPISVTEEPKPEAPARVEVKESKPPEAPKREEYHWQMAPASTQPAPGTWAPASSAQPAPTPVPVPPTNEAPAWKSGAANVKPVVARAQMSDNTPDPITTLVRQVCQGRATFVEVRWTGTKKLIVSFEVRTAVEAQRLVTDLSRQKELAPYQIDFCAIVK